MSRYVFLAEDSTLGCSAKQKVHGVEFPVTIKHHKKHPKHYTQVTTKDIVQKTIGAMVVAVVVLKK